MQVNMKDPKTLKKILNWSILIGSGSMFIAVVYSLYVGYASV
jgi:hypothetical protein